VQIIAIGAEVTAVAIYFGFWFVHIPGWVWVLLVSCGLVFVNALDSRFPTSNNFHQVMKAAIPS
jgi:L-asparagine transporter-like permease